MKSVKMETDFYRKDAKKEETTNGPNLTNLLFDISPSFIV